MDPAALKIAEGVASKGGEGTKLPSVGGDSPFQKVLEQQLSSAHDSTRMVQEMFHKTAAFQVMPASEMKVDAGRLGNGRPSSVVEMLGEVNRSALQMDQMVEMVMSGQSFSAQELLAMQAGVYRIVEEVNLTGQIVSSADRARNSLLNIQV